MVTPLDKTSYFESFLIEQEHTKLQQKLFSTHRKASGNKCLLSRSNIMSACGRMKGQKECLFTIWGPLIRYIQIQGLFPLSLDFQNCKVTYSWKSPLNLYNLAWIIINILGSLVVFYSSARVILMFKGTDFYTVVILVILQFMATIFSYAVGGYGANNLSKGLQMLHDTVTGLGFSSMKQVKWFLFFIPINLVVEAVFNMVVSIFQIDAKYNVSPIVAVMATFITNVIPNILVSLMAVSMWTIGYYFNHINELVHEILSQSKCKSSPRKDDYSDAIKISKLRHVHEELCEAARYFTKAFELQLLVIFPATSVRLIAGLYGMIVGFLGLSTISFNFLIAQSIACVMAAGRIFLVIGSSEYIIKRASEVSKILKRSRTMDNSSELNEEIDTFLTKLGTYPLEIKCCNIIRLDSSFLSSAVPNAITYLLVLMQFKQGDTSGFQQNENNTMTNFFNAINGSANWNQLNKDNVLSRT